jgi:glycosyltransferase involved in cell wall biosynthesis
MSRKKKAVIFMGPLSSGGAEKQALLLAMALGNDLDFTVVSYYGEVKLLRMVDFAAEHNIRVEYLFGGAVKKIIAFNKLIGTIKPDILFMYLPSNNLIGGMVGKLHGVKKRLGGVRTSRLPKFHFGILYIAHNLLNHRTIFNNYEGFRHLTEQGFKPDNGVVIHNCFHEVSSPLDRPVSDVITILTSARFEHYKDFESAIIAFSKLVNQTNTNTRYRIVGTGSMKNQIIGWIEHYGVSHLVDIIENPEDMDVHYRECDIYFCSSSYEGLSNSLLEAMNRCLPLVSTKVGDHDKLAIDDRTGYLVDVGDTNAMTDRLKILAEDANKRLRFGRNAHEILTSEFSVSKFRERYLALIKDPIKWQNPE